MHRAVVTTLPPSTLPYSEGSLPIIYLRTTALGLAFALLQLAAVMLFPLGLAGYGLAKLARIV